MSPFFSLPFLPGYLGGGVDPDGLLELDDILLLRFGLCCVVALVLGFQRLTIGVEIYADLKIEVDE